MATQNNQSKLVTEIGAGLLAAAAAAGTGYYYFYASDTATKHRQTAAKWARALRKDVVAQARVVGKASPKAFAKIIDEAALAYATARNIRKEDVRAAADELKKNWRGLHSEFERAAKEAKTAPITTAKGVAKKSAKKARR